MLLPEEEETTTTTLCEFLLIALAGDDDDRLHHAPRAGTDQARVFLFCFPRETYHQWQPDDDDD
jgi:hypothetical protein